MTHEPECPIRNNEDPLTLYAARIGVATFCICPNIRYAYQRGRQDERQAYCRENPPIIITAKWYHLAEWIIRALRAEKGLAKRNAN